MHDQKSGFLVKGWVDDAVVAMQSARVCLAPLRFGAGIKGKLAEAMYCQTPSVTTDIGGESMQTAKPWAGSIQNQAEDFVNAAVSLHEKQDLWKVASDLGQVNASTMFQQASIFADLSSTVTTLLANITAHRQANFIGAMLSHHNHKSTQYMAQWIDVKTQLQQLQDMVDG